MGCNCKNKVEAINKKYGNDGKENRKPNIIFRFFAFLFRLAFGLLFGVLIFVVFIPMFIYVIVCVMLGKEASFSLEDLLKHFRKKN